MSSSLVLYIRNSVWLMYMFAMFSSYACYDVAFGVAWFGICHTHSDPKCHILMTYVLCIRILYNISPTQECVCLCVFVSIGICVYVLVQHDLAHCYPKHDVWMAYLFFVSHVLYLTLPILCKLCSLFVPCIRMCMSMRIFGMCYVLILY